MREHGSIYRKHLSFLRKNVTANGTGAHAAGTFHNNMWDKPLRK